MTTQECAHFLGVSDNVIYTAIKEKRLVAYKLSTQSIRIRRSDFLRYIEASKTA